MPSFARTVILCVVLPIAAHAQSVVLPPTPGDSSGCIGFGYSVILDQNRITEMTVTSVDSLSPAGLAGLRTGDFVVSIDKKPVTEAGIQGAGCALSSDFNHPPGTTLRLSIIRRGPPFELQFQTGVRTSGQAGGIAPACRPGGRKEGEG
jgi:S1-C subfamily serine protease